MNPSAWPIRIVFACFALIAASIATYMGLYQLQIIHPIWDPIFGDGTQRVLNSQVSVLIRHWIHIPDALLGAISYFLDIILVFIGNSERWRKIPWFVLLFGISVIPTCLVSAILVFLQGTIVGSWCFLCLVSATISLVLVALSYNEVSKAFRYLLKKRRNGNAN